MHRSLLQAAVSAGLASGHAGESTTLGLRIASVFIIWAAGFFGGTPPLLMRTLFEGQVAACILRALAGGVILALGVIHVAPDSILDLAKVTDYPAGAVCIVAGILMCLVMDTTLMTLHASINSARCNKPMDGRHGPPTAPAALDGAASGTAAAGAAAAGDKDAELALPLPQPSMHSHGHHHHMCLSASAATHQAAASAMEEASGSGSKDAATVAARKIAVAYTMEAGCIFHSVIIGLGLGVIADNTNLVITLIIALIFHQALEALALSSMFSVARFSTRKCFIMLLAYSVTAPLGIALGIGLSATYDPESVTALVTQGVLNGVSSGMLIYISLIELIAEEITRDDLQRRPGLKAAAFGALLLGASSMAVLAIWA